MRRPSETRNSRLPAVVYHLAEAANFDSIRRDGLLSASALVRAAGLAGDDLDRLESTCRLAHTRLPGGAEIRDQRPMPAAALVRCLVGVSPAEWYRAINERVFFWVDPARLNRQRAACKHRPQVVMVVSVERLLARHADRVALSPINSGNARRQPAVRGLATFVPYAQWARSGWASEAAALGTRPRPRTHPAAELTVLGAVPDVMEMVARTVRLRACEPFVPDGPERSCGAQPRNSITARATSAGFSS
jgi:hypothetical protein